MMALRAFFVAAAMLGVAASSDPDYDHQTETYTAHFNPVTVTDQAMTLTPFFSPDHSIDTLTNMIQAVSYGGKIDIGTPSYSSWSSCTSYGSCNGCSIADMKKEPFPMFPAILNAVHQKKATVRILTNNYNDKTCEGDISPWDFLVLNGVDVRYYTSTTFMHAKYLAVDGKNVSVSSVNWSQTSYTQNREAGLILGQGTDALQSFTAAVFEYDFQHATKHEVAQTYTSSEMKEITDSSVYPVNIPPPPEIAGAYRTPFPSPITEFTTATIYTSPDFARAHLLPYLESAKSSLQLYIYEITDAGICDTVLGLHQRGLNVTVLVSNYVVSYGEYAASTACYTKMVNAGLTVMKAATYYKFEHQKYWVIDGKYVGLSTGNFAATDYPDQDVFPAYGTGGHWAKANRDFTIHLTNSGIARVFQQVFAADYERGYPFKPKA